MKANSERFSGIQGLIFSFVDKSTKSIYTEDMEQTEKIMKFFMITGKMEKQVTKLKSLYMKEFDLNGSDLPILLALQTCNEGLRQDEFCKMAGSDKAQISRSLSRLMNHGLIEKDNSTLYKSKYTLSSVGIKTAEYLSEQSVHIFDAAHSILDNDQWDGFYSFLESLNVQIEHMINQKESESSKQNVEQ